MRPGHVAFLAACLTAASQPGWAECLPLHEFARQLAAKYHEAPVARAIQGGMPIVIFASANGQTFTVVGITESGRTACTLAAGTGWQAVDRPIPGSES